MIKSCSVSQSDLESILFYLESLSKGIDPTCNHPFMNDTVLNNNQIQLRLSQAYNLLTELINQGYKMQKNNSLKQISIQRQDIDAFDFDDESITISKLIYRINGCYKKHGMRNLRAPEITDKLVNDGYLEIIDVENRKQKIPTDKGIRLGISLHNRVTDEGLHYQANYYNRSAQMHVLEYLVE